MAFQREATVERLAAELALVHDRVSVGVRELFVLVERIRSAERLVTDVTRVGSCVLVTLLMALHTTTTTNV